MYYDFEWDFRKARINKRKHKISFEQAATVFRDPKGISFYDTENSKKEDRWITMGLSTNGSVLVVCHTYYAKDKETVTIRIISARKATKKEKKQYTED